MATKRNRGSSWHYIVKRAGLLPRPIYLSFDDEAEGDKYVEQLEQLLARGIVPDEFLRRQHELRTVQDAIRAYQRTVDVPLSDQDILGVVQERLGRDQLCTINYAWCERWVTRMKQTYVLAPSTIRHHVGALARCFDWMVRCHPDALPVNPLRQLPKRYASYTDTDRKATDGGRKDMERDRRLLPGEDERIRAILDGEKPEDRERAFTLEWQGALECLYDLALETAMRLREMYTLDLAQVDLKQRTIFLDKTKNGNKRQVPLSTVAIATIERYLAQVGDGERNMKGFDFGSGRLFPWWDGDGDAASLRKTTSLLSRQFGRIFLAAKCRDLRFHDLRHEATCRLYERTTLSDLQIGKITGHKDIRMLARYANLRGSDLAGKLW